MRVARVTLVVLLSTWLLPWQRVSPAEFPAPKGPARAQLYQQIATLRQAWNAGRLRTAATADDVRVCQNWLDLLEDEGCIHPSGFTGTPLEMFDELNTANKQLASSSPELPATVDALVGRLDRLCGTWYADGTAGDISPNWVTPRRWTLKHQDGHALVLSIADASGPAFDLTITAFRGGFRIHGPAEGFFESQTLASAPLTVKQDGGQLTLSSGSDTMKVALDPLQFSIIRGQNVLWEQSGPGLLPGGTGQAGVKAVRVDGSLTPADHFFGLGERFDALDHRGRVVSNWSSDSLFASVRSRWTETYKPVPLVIDPRGVSTFYNVQTLVRIDCGATDPQRQSFVAPGAVLDEYLFVGDPMSTIRGYTRLTGEPIDVPGWALEPWMGGGVERWNIHGADHSCDEVRTAVERMRQLDIPHSAIYIEGLPCDKPNGRALVSWLLNEQHLKPIAWYGPIAGTDETDSFTPDQLRHLLVNEPTGKPFVNPPGRFLAGNYYIDFTNPLSVEMLIRKWKWHIDEGIRGCMIDGGEEAPRDGVYANGLGGDVMHNLYPLFYHRAHQALFDELSPNDYVLFGRSGAPGDQASMGQFPGDMPGDFGGLTGAIHAALTASSSGFSIWGSDVGGYWSRDGNAPSKSVYLRWLQFAIFSPLTRVHGEKSPREPWNWDDETVGIYKYFAWLKENLHPYLVDVASAGHHSGEPMMRPLPLVYPNDAAAMAVDDEYLFGPDLLVAPLHTLDNSREVYLPAGTWYDVMNGLKPTDGGSSTRVETPLSKLPAYARGGGIMPLKLNAAWELGQSMTPGAEPVTLVLPSVSLGTSLGQGLTMRRDGDDVLISADSDAIQALWIPSPASHEVQIGGEALALTAALPAPGPLNAACFDPHHHRICVRARLVPGADLRIKGYFGSPTASSTG